MHSLQMIFNSFICKFWLNSFYLEDFHGVFFSYHFFYFFIFSFHIPLWILFFFALFIATYLCSFQCIVNNNWVSIHCMCSAWHFLSSAFHSFIHSLYSIFSSVSLSVSHSLNQLRETFLFSFVWHFVMFLLSFFLIHQRILRMVFVYLATAIDVPIPLPRILCATCTFIFTITECHSIWIFYFENFISKLIQVTCLLNLTILVLS